MSAIDFEIETVNFSLQHGQEKDFIRGLIERQLQIAYFLANIYGNKNLLNDYLLLLAAVKNSSIPKVLAKRLVGVIRFSDFSREFIAVMDNYFP